MHYKKFPRVIIFTCICIATALALPFMICAQDKEMKVKHESGIYYTIQKGDTLWDLSERFFDSPALWPGLWNENNQIPNPHRIYPGEQIRLYHQKGVQPVRIIKKVEKPPEEKIPEPKPEPKKEEPPFYYYSPIESIGFIRKEPIDPKGTIFRAFDNKILISQGDMLYVRQNKDSEELKVGTQYTTYRIYQAKGRDKWRAYIATYGEQYYLSGVIEITKREPDYFIARVVRTYRSIAINDQLMPYTTRSPKTVLTPSKEGMLGEVITSEERSRIFGDSTIAFINKGIEHGINVGQFYSVFYQDRHGLDFTGSLEQKKELLTPIDFGTILVLHTEKNTSTVLVTNSIKDLYPTVAFRTPVK